MGISIYVYVCVYEIVLHMILLNFAYSLIYVHRYINTHKQTFIVNTPIYPPLPPWRRPHPSPALAHQDLHLGTAASFPPPLRPLYPVLSPSLSPEENHSIPRRHSWSSSCVVLSGFWMVLLACKVGRGNGSLFSVVIRVILLCRRVMLKPSCVSRCNLHFCSLFVHLLFLSVSELLYLFIY